MKRGSVPKAGAKLVNLWFPKDLIPLLDEAVAHEDSDRSKFIRNAVRDRIDRVKASKTALTAANN